MARIAAARIIARTLMCALAFGLAGLAACKGKDAPALPSETPAQAQEVAPTSDIPVSPEEAAQRAAASSTPGGQTPRAAMPVCTPASQSCVAIKPFCPSDVTGCVTAEIDFNFPASFFERTSVLDGLALAERHPRWSGAKDDTPGAETAWRNWSAHGVQKGRFWTSVTMKMDLRLGDSKAVAERPVAFFTDVAFQPLSPTFGFSRVALLGWTKSRQPILLTDKGPAVVYSKDVSVAAPNAYLIVDKAKAKIVARLAAPTILREGRFALIDRKHMFYWSPENGTPRCVKAFGPGLRFIEKGDATCGGLSGKPEADGDYGLAQANAADVAIVRKAAPFETKQADEVGCGPDAANRVYRFAEDESVLAYAAQIICD